MFMINCILLNLENDQFYPYYSGLAHRRWSNHMIDPLQWSRADKHTVYPKKYAHGFCFAVLCCGLAKFKLNYNCS